MSKLIINLLLILFLAFTTNVFAMEEDAKDTYCLKVGPKGLDRMQFQNKLLAEDTEEHIGKVGPLEGKKVLDVGCGFGIMSVDLATRVGSTGHVYGIDISVEQLAVAQEKAAALCLKNVTFCQHDVRSLSDFRERDFDVVYIRYVLSHINNPKDVITGAKALLKEGGVIATQDVVVSSFWQPHQEDIFVEFRELGAKMAEKTGNDYEIGLRLQELHEEVGFTKVDAYFRQPPLSVADAKKLFLLTVVEGTDKAIESKMLAPETLENWQNTMSAWPEEDPLPFHMAKSGYVLAWK
ncbi:MAG TPA: class I SAM-dependent methyltransferase [Alphaproteobacteria bacterium]|nr:class I SAM-dependent methyltransferase [Alphaproteobacteria bacterium]